MDYLIILDDNGSTGKEIVIPKEEITIYPITRKGFTANFVGKFEDDRHNLWIHSYSII